MRGRGAAVKYLSHNASFHSKEKIAPSNRGIKQLELFAAKSPQGAVRRLLPRLRAKILQDRAQLELAGFDNHYRIADQADINDTADTLSRFLALPAHTLRADDLAEDLFSNEDAHVL